MNDSHLSTSEVYFPKIMRGEWYPDGWITPYIRANFILPASSYKLHVEFYIPPTYTVPSINIRISGYLLYTINDLPADALTSYEIELEHKDPNLELALSIATSSKIEKSEQDERYLGLLVKSWELRRVP